MNPKRSAITAFRTSRFRSVELALAGLFSLSLVGFLVTALVPGEGSVGDTVATGLLWTYLGTIVALPLLVLVHSGYTAVNWIRGDRGTVGQSTGMSVISSTLRAVEVGLAVVILLVVGFLGQLFLTQPGGEGAGAVAIGGGLLLTFVGSCLAVTVLVGGIFRYTRLSLD